MIFFTSRSAKKAAEKEQEKKGKPETVNPYKEAKRTGKSVEEIVEKDQKRKAKQAEALAKQKEKEAKWRQRRLEREKAASTKKVSVRNRSAAGSDYKVTVKKPEPPKHSSKGTTNPKNQSGKQKNKNKKK